MIYPLNLSRLRWGVASSEQRWYRTIDGIQYETDGEELVIPEDPQGETKIDKLGNLLGGKIVQLEILDTPNITVRRSRSKVQGLHIY